MPIGIRFLSQPGNVLLTVDWRAVITDFGSTGPARISVRSRQEALVLQEWAERKLHLVSVTYAASLYHEGISAFIPSRTCDHSLFRPREVYPVVSVILPLYRPFNSFRDPILLCIISLADLCCCPNLSDPSGRPS